MTMKKTINKEILTAEEKRLDREWTARKLRRLADEQLDREWAERKARKAHTAPLTIGK